MATAAAAVLLLSTAACGGSGGGGTAADPALRSVKKTSSGPCQIARADVDGDGVVSIFDLTLVSFHFGETVPPAPPQLDQDGDKAITILDLHLVESVFLQRVSDCP